MRTAAITIAVVALAALATSIVWAQSGRVVPATWTVTDGVDGMEITGFIPYPVTEPAFGSFTHRGVVIPNGPTVGSPDAWGLSEPELITWAGKYRVYYECRGESLPWGLCWATSSDLFHWEKQDPIQGITSGVGPEPAIVTPVDSIDGKWHLFHTLGDSVLRAEIGHAVSDDGIDWAPVDHAVSLEHIDRHGTFTSWSEPSVVRMDSQYIMYAEVYERGFSHIAYATSPDLHHWTLHDIVIPDAAGPSVRHHNDRYYMFFNWQGIELASSSDGINWTRHGTVIEPEPGTWNDQAVYEPTWTIREGQAHVLFGGYCCWAGKWSEDLDLQIGLATGRLE